MQDKKDTNKWVDTLAKDLESVNPVDELLEESLDLLDEMLAEMLEEIKNLYIRQALLAFTVMIQTVVILYLYIQLSH